MTAPADATAAILERCLAAPALLPGSAGPGTGRLLCLDGPAGSGKTGLAAAVERRAAEPGTRSGHQPDPGSGAGLNAVRVLHLDDLYEGWGGLAAVADRLRDEVVAPLAEGGRGRYRRWDWRADGWAEEHAVEPVDLLVLEGVGSGTPELARWRSLLVWLDAPADLRRRRATARDGEGLAAFWDAWAASEAGVFARDRTRERADLRVDGADGRELLVR